MEKSYTNPQPQALERKRSEAVKSKNVTKNKNNKSIGSKKKDIIKK